MKEKKDDFDLIAQRFIDFYKIYNPNLHADSNILQAAKKCAELVTGQKIDFATFDRITGEVEKEMITLPYGWNHAAYVIDWVRGERLEAAQNEASQYNQPIVLNKVGTPLTESKNPRLQAAIAKIKATNPELYAIISKIKVRPEEQRYNFCSACQNSGFIIDDGKKRAKRCVCQKGESMTKQAKQANHEEARQSAQRWAEYEA